MTLREWLFKRRLSITAFASFLKTDRSYVHKWMQGKKIPSERIMKKIREITMNEIVSEKDLIDKSAELPFPARND